MTSESQSARKKRRESAFFELARHLQPDMWPVSDDEDHDGERPDVVVRHDHATYGVEVVELVDQGTRVSEEHRRKTCARARALAGLPVGLEVAVLFRGAALDSKSAREEVSSKIAKLATERAARYGDVDWRERIDLWRTDLWPFASTIFMHNIPGWPNGRWYSAEAWGVGHLMPARIRSVIADKEARLAAYRERADRIDLLIVAENFRSSTAVHLPEKTLQVEYCTAFDRVVLLDCGNHAVHVLNTRLGEQPSS